MSKQTIQKFYEQWLANGDLDLLHQAIHRELGLNEFEALFLQAARESLAVDKDEIVQAVKEGVEAGAKYALDQVYGSQILDAITDGTTEALKRTRR